jgi:hypothetical protein
VDRASFLLISALPLASLPSKLALAPYSLLSFPLSLKEFSLTKTPKLPNHSPMATTALAPQVSLQILRQAFVYLMEQELVI